MLHFPSKNTAAHRPAPTDVARLHQLLGDHVWAFSNCRVDAPGLQVAEVDWLFYNSVKGTFILSEWKRYPSAVVQVMDEGKPWLLASGSTVPNPVEQVGKQLQAVRRTLQLTICTKYFPAADQHSVNVYPSVYSPQVDDETRRERLRYGVVHGSLDDVAQMVERRAVTAPLIVAGGSARLELAEALAELFRCAIGSTARRKIDPPAPARPVPAVRMAAIHRELAALHIELASLLEIPESQAVPGAAVPVTVPPGPAAVHTPSVPVAAPAPVPPAPLPSPASKPAGPVTAAPKTGYLQHHVTTHVPLSKAKAQHVRAAFLAALQDGQLRHSGVHIGLFGNLVAQRLKGGPTLASLAPGSLRKWCLAQAAAAGVAASIDKGDPSVVRLTK